MALIVEAPEENYSIENERNTKIFLAGGISNCPNWQKEMIDRLKNVKHLTIYNPRRENFPMDNPKAAETQIAWEFDKLRKADIISFWFSEGTVQPIVLYELGMWANSRDVEYFIGIHPDYQRKQDVIIQSQLAGYKYGFIDNIPALAKILEIEGSFLYKENNQ